MGEIITIQVGQCGNQIGAEFWGRLCAEHGLSSSGRISSDVDGDRKDVFFYQADDGRFLPRAVLIDLEPRVVSAALAQRPEFYNSENVFLSNDGGGAGNNWAYGYQRGRENREAIIDMVQREAECSEFLDGFLMFHSIAGGTGSGLGSFLLEELQDELGAKKKIESFSIFPNNEEVSDVVVQPYNSVLTLSRLRAFCSGVITMDNGALGRVAADSLRITAPTFAHTNSLASIVASAATSTFRFPGSRFSDFASLLGVAAPVAGCHFFVPSYSPFVEPGFRIVRKTSCLDVQRRLLLPKTRLATYEESEANCFLSAVNVMMGAAPEDVEKSLQRFKQRGALKFAPWAAASVQVALGKSMDPGRVSGLLLGNNTGFARALKKICVQFDRLKSRKAFVDMYRKEGAVGEDLAEFDEARESVQWIIDEYQACELNTYAF